MFIRIFCLLILFFCTELAFSQTPVLSKFENGSRRKCHLYNPSAGDSLIYDVQMVNGDQYLFKVFLKNYDPTGTSEDKYCAVMEWISTSSQGKKGTVFLTCDGMIDAIKYVNYFMPGITILNSNFSSIFLSKKSYLEREKQSIYIDNVKVDLYEIKGAPVADLSVKNKKKKYTIEAYRLVDNPNLNYADSSYTSEYEVWVQANVRSPLIVYMRLPQFSIKLLEIK
ncbi:MAG: hypothetical protein ACK4KT_05720 [Thermaurantimonas sp.]